MPAEPTYVGNMAPALMTAEELLHTRVPNKRFELVRGGLVTREFADYRAGRSATELLLQIANHVQTHQLGAVVAGGTGFVTARDPDTVRAPSGAFVRASRMPDPTPSGYPDIAPDLVVEVLSTTDSPGSIVAKVGDWLEAGTPLVWVVDPERRLARVYRPDGSETIVTADGALDGEDVLPGFSCPLVSIL